MKIQYIKTDRLKARGGFEKDKGGVICYRCGRLLPEADISSKIDRFGRSFCGEDCRKIYYGGKMK